MVANEKLGVSSKETLVLFASPKISVNGYSFEETDEGEKIHVFTV